MSATMFMAALAKTARRLVHRVVTEEDKFGFFASRLLWGTGLCRLIVFDMPDGFRLRFYPSSCSTAFWLNRHFRDGDSALLRRFLRPGSTFVDVGANIGHLSLLAATRVGPSGRVVAVEAHPSTYKFLLGNVALNGHPIEAHNVAIGEQAGEACFTSLHSDDQNRALLDVGAGPGVRVEMTTLDRLLDMPHVDLLKIDTEGFELHILSGASETLKRCAAIYIEDSDRNLHRYGGSSLQLRRKLGEAGFALFRIVRDQAIPVAATDEPKSKGAGNLFAVRQGSVDELLDRARLTRVA